MSDEAAETPNADATTASHDSPMSAELRAAIAQDWDPAPVMPHPARPDGAPFTAQRRAALSAAFPGQLIVVPAGPMKPRANDTDYPYRAASSFTWLTGETVESAVLVLTPSSTGHDSTLYVVEYAAPGKLEYFTDRMHGALWVGGAPTPAETAEALGITTRARGDLESDVAGWRDRDCAVLTGFDPAVDALFPRGNGNKLGEVLDELRLVKDAWEIARLQHACDATALGEGNTVGYTSIVGAGVHGTTLHWWRDDGPVQAGQLLLADMGIETDELYTADVTRTMPVSGEWTPDQLRIYRAVYEAQSAGIAEVKAGADFLAAHNAAMWVLADHLHSWGILPVTAEVSCADDPERPGAGLHRRYTLHGTSHMLGIDVHDCALAREQNYRKGTLAAGYVLTVEPGLYFQPNDRTVPAELRGLAVRIEDDILVTDGAPLNLSGSLPRDADEVTAWMREVQSTPAVP